MDSAIFIFVITILQIILDCSGIGLREPRRTLQRRASNIYAGREWPGSHNRPSARQHKTGARRYMYSSNKDISEEGDIYQVFRENYAPEIAVPVLFLVVLRSEDEENPIAVPVLFLVVLRSEDEENPLAKREIDRTGRTHLKRRHTKPATSMPEVDPQNDWRFRAIDARRTNPFFNFTEQELPIAHYVKDYHKIELEIQKREAEMKRTQPIRKGVEISSTKTDAPVDYFSQNYNRFKAEMMQNQNRFQTMPDDKNPQKSETDSLSLKKKESLLQEYEQKQNRLYNNYDGRNIPSPEQPESQHQDPQAPNPQDMFMFPRPESQDPQISRPQFEDGKIQRPRIQHGMESRPKGREPLNQQAMDMEDIFNGLHNWQPEQLPPNSLASLGIKPGDENYNLQAVLDQSSLNLADMSTERLVSEYRRLEKEILRRKDLLEIFKKTLKQAQMEAYNEKIKKAFYNPPSLPRPPNSPVLQDPRASMGLAGPSNPQGQSSPLNLPNPPESPIPLELGPPDRYPLSPTQRLELGFKKDNYEEKPDYGQPPYMSDEESREEIPEPRQLDQELVNNGTPQFDQLYIIYLKRIGYVSPRRRMRRRKPLGIGALYAYVDLEHIEDVINQFRRQQANSKPEPEPELKPELKKRDLTVHDEPSISTDESSNEDKALENRPSGKMNWFLNSGDAFSHIRIDPQAPDMEDFMPKQELEKGNKWWFYHQNDYLPFRGR